MHINRLRLLGFKSFVEPTELVIEKGLTGVVGPNGCGKSNLLEALRWVMGETSHKSMRAAAMDDVIFSGTTTRPPRNTAEVTIFIDNSDRSAPAEYNDCDMRGGDPPHRARGGLGLSASTAREVRARDVRILFEDAATGARSPALVRQGQIGETGQRQARAAPTHPGGRRRDRRAAQPPARGRAAAEGGGGQSRARSTTSWASSTRRSKASSARLGRRAATRKSRPRSASSTPSSFTCDGGAQAQVDGEEPAWRRRWKKSAAPRKPSPRPSQERSGRGRAACRRCANRRPRRCRAAALQDRAGNLERESAAHRRPAGEFELRVEQLGRDLAREETLIAEAKETLDRLTAEDRIDREHQQAGRRIRADRARRHDKSDGLLKTAGGAPEPPDRGGGGSARAALRAWKHTPRREAPRADGLKLERQLTALEAQTREIRAGRRTPPSSRRRRRPGSS